MDKHLVAIHDSSIRLNSLANMKCFVGRSTTDTEESRIFSKAIDAALISGLDTEAISRQLAISLGGQKQAREFLKAHVKDYYRSVGGKMVLVKEHDTTQANGSKETARPAMKTEGSRAKIKELNKAEAIALAEEFNTAMKTYRRAFKVLCHSDDETHEQTAARVNFFSLRRKCISTFGISGQSYNKGNGLDATQICERYLTPERAAAYWESHNK